MSIEVTVNEDIREYESKVLGNNFTIRQATSIGIALALDAFIVYLTYNHFGQAQLFILGIIDLPILVCGFINPGGFRFEEYARVVINNALQLPIRSYRNSNGLRELESICFKYEKNYEKSTKKFKLFKKMRKE
ncbi:PrgI family protein [Clostridium butyricum]|uniref:PrgI family protein n=1 Tax=Clostridium butyricum TaxID=1492 RepID=UPI0022E43787|nr:PrgI family protein [Clostridium butyricum]MDU3597537.1 PrgI family protein [Clostridium butyricum]